MTLTEIEQSLLTLLKGEFSSLHVSFNSHASSYLSPEDAADEDLFYPGESWVSPDEKAKAIASNSFWSVQWYPDTPIGSYQVVASSLQAAIEGALAQKD